MLNIKLILTRTLTSVVLFTLFLMHPARVQAQAGEAYRIYSPEGEVIGFDDWINAMKGADVVFLGELHNNPIDHWLQLEVIRSLDSEKEVQIGAERFEWDDQLILEEYLTGKITMDHLRKEAKVWPNFQTDYQPIVEYAKDEGIDFIATNVSRRYASITSKEGQAALKSLPKASADFLPSLPFDLPEEDRGYLEMKEMMGGHSHGMKMETLIEAQALKDYTMATAIKENRDKDAVFVHLNGSFHTQYRAGLAGYLARMQPKWKMIVVASVSSDSDNFDPSWAELGDFIVWKPESMTKTH